MNLIVIDYGLGNVQSVINAFKSQGAHPVLSNDPKEILKARGIVLPGVGSFPQGMSQLKLFGLIDVLVQYAKSGKPFLGICLGMQMLLSNGEEFATTPGLGLISGNVVSFKSQQELLGRVPHVGWSSLEESPTKTWEDTILHDIVPGTKAYFVHSFIAKPEERNNVLANTTYQGVRFCSVVQQGNIYGCQFHPEKSGPDGLKILENFLEIMRGI